MATKAKTGSSKGVNKRSTKPSKSGPSSKPKKTASAPKPTQHKPKSTTSSTIAKKRKPPHLRYSEKELKLPALNGIRPAGVEKLPNKKKGKQFVDDGDGMKTILAMVMAEKEGDIESKMMRARRMEQLREARRVEAEKRAEGKKAGLEEKKAEIRKGKKRRRGGDDDGVDGGDVQEETARETARTSKKRVSFG